MSTNYYAVRDEDEEYWNGLHLGKRAGGWQPYFQWHVGCSCCSYDDELPYRNFGELCEFIADPDVTVVDEYGEEYTTGEFIDMVIRWREENRRSQASASPKDGFVIDGWEFVTGDWS